jgi:monovalent cation:H+ antiporter-2, CPA2 family
VSLTALRRRGVRDASPSLEMRIEVADVLILAGTPEALAKAEMRLLQG